MTSTILIFLFVGLLIVLFFVGLRASRHQRVLSAPVFGLEPEDRKHVAYLPLMRQALSQQDLDYLRSRGSRSLESRVCRERRFVALAYLSALRADFRRLLRMARAIAALSPEVNSAHELERLRLTWQFAWRFQFIRLRLLCNATALPQLASLGDMVSVLSVRLEAAIRELGEKAAVAGEIASALERRSLDSAS